MNLFAYKDSEWVPNPIRLGPFLKNVTPLLITLKMELWAYLLN